MFDATEGKAYNFIINFGNQAIKTGSLITIFKASSDGFRFPAFVPGRVTECVYEHGSALSQIIALYKIKIHVVYFLCFRTFQQAVRGKLTRGSPFAESEAKHGRRHRASGRKASSFEFSTGRLTIDIVDHCAAQTQNARTNATKQCRSNPCRSARQIELPEGDFEVFKTICCRCRYWNCCTKDKTTCKPTKTRILEETHTLIITHLISLSFLLGVTRSEARHERSTGIRA